MIVSLNPWYYCNFSCSFCYLTPAQLSDKTILSLERVEVLLRDLMWREKITHVDIYGGEVLLLPADYLNDLKVILKKLGIKSFSIITNLSLLTDAVFDDEFHLTISYDFGAREKSDVVLNNIFSLPRSYSILTLASRGFLDTVTPDEYVNTLNMLAGMEIAEIKPYSSNQANNDPVSYKEFEEFVWAVLNHPQRKFELENEHVLEDAFSSEGRNAFSDDHIYITPNGKYAVLDFDDDDNELFLELESYADYRAWCDGEKKRIAGNTFCGACEYKGSCLSEHLRTVKSVENSCNGFYGLLKLWEVEK